MLRFFLFLCLLAPFLSQGQYKTYKIGVKGDTLNAVDMKGQKQGKWVIRLETVRGEPGYEEEGVFKDDKKEGIWRRYNLVGDIIAIENYKWGNKDGLSRYFSIMGSLRDETWRAINPENPYDTVEVPDPLDPFKVTMQVIKVEGAAVKHGVWRYYDPASGAITRTETYFLGKLEDPNKKLLTATNAADSSMEVRKKLSDDSKPKEIQDYDKKNSGKKKVKIREGRSGY